MNAPIPIPTPILNAAHEVLAEATAPMCAQEIAAAINGHPRPTKPQIKAVRKMLEAIHACGMLASQSGRGGLPLYVLTTPVCDLVQTEGASQTSSSAERVLTPEARADRDDFEREVEERGCTCFISPPCGFCTHPGNPRNQEEDETAWMTAGDSEGGETDAPAAINDTPKFGHGLSCGACHDGCAGEQCKVERDSPPVDSQREEFTLLGLIADIRAAAGDPDGRLMQDELVQHIAAIVKERDDLRERLDAQIKQWQADPGRLTADLRAAMESRSQTINEADRLRAELAAERQARVAELEADRAEREKQEPVAWMEWAENAGAWFLAYSENPDVTTKPLYAAPPVAAPVRLMDSDTHAKDLRRMARKIGHPAGDVPAVMRAAADRIDELERLVAAFQRAEAGG